MTLEATFSLKEERAIKRAYVCDQLARLSYQRREEHEEPFRLASGATSFEYLDCRQALSHGHVLSNVCELLADRMLPGMMGVGGLTMGADALAVGTALAMKHEDFIWFSVRKEAKDHGKGRRIEGAAHRMMPVCIVDDVCTTGGSTIKAIEACREAGMNIKQVIILVDREVGGLENIKAALADYRNPWVSALFTKTEIADAYTRTRR